MKPITYFEAMRLKRATGMSPMGLGIVCALLERNLQSEDELVAAAALASSRGSACGLFKVHLSQLRATLPAGVSIAAETRAGSARRFRLVGGDALLAIARPKPLEQTP